jgi:hypothetical protein
VTRLTDLGNSIEGIVRSTPDVPMIDKSALIQTIVSRDGSKCEATVPSRKQYLNLLKQGAPGDFLCASHECDNAEEVATLLASGDHSVPLKVMVEDFDGNWVEVERSPLSLVY